MERTFLGRNAGNLKKRLINRFIIYSIVANWEEMGA